MNYALAMLWDDETESELRKVMGKQKTENKRDKFLSLNIPPHVTLINYKDPELDSLKAAVKELAEGQSKIKLALSSAAVSMELGHSYILPTATAELLDFQKKAYERTKDLGFAGFERDYPGKFEAHCTLDTDTDLDVLCKNAELYARSFAPRIATVDSIGIILCERPSFDVVYRCELN